MATACAHQAAEPAHQSAEPYVLGEDADVDVAKLMLADQLSKFQIIYGYADSSSEIYIDKTVLAAEAGDSSPNLVTGPMCGSKAAEGLVCGPLVGLAHYATVFVLLVTAPVIVPGALIQSLVDTTTPPEAAGSAPAAADPPASLVPANAQLPLWFTGFQDDDHFHSSLDDRLISALDATLKESRQKRAANTGRPATVQIRAGISHIALLNVKDGGQLLIVCGRLTVYPRPDRYKTYETCQSEKMESALSDVTQMRTALTSGVHRMAQAKHELLASKRTVVAGMGAERPWSITPGTGVAKPGAASEAFVNCVANGQRQWTYRSKCD